ncbi:MAG TPA: M1 family metallopeptidase [Gemmatimonadales bacterium]|nr:M1 family metallopeptidase [Gemmatimonadales bacterium]
MVRAILAPALVAGLFMSAPSVAAQRCPAPVDPYDSGGRLDPEEAVYDVEFYDLAVRVDPGERSIAGRLDLHARMTGPAATVALDLDTLLDIESITPVGDSGILPVERCGGRVRVSLRRTFQPGERLALRVRYAGRPRVAPRPPWDGGFTWARTRSGAPWIATSNQMLGADVWWPVKDHISDKPDSLALSVTAPAALVVAANGRLRGVDSAAGGTRTWRWFVSTPISTYNVALNIAPYRSIDTVVPSVAGDSIPVSFYVLEEDYDRGRALFPQILAHLAWYERRLGPYAFRADKYGVAQTPHLGMEHQSIIAYGANFSNRSMTGGVDWGFDALHHHELSHEWWGNLVTNADWKDMWLHEGFGSYMQVLWVEDTQGPERAREYLRGMLGGMGNRRPMAPREATSAKDIYAGHDIYNKGAWVLHTLRWLIGDDVFFRSLRRMAYPDSALARTTDGRAVRFADTRDFQTIVEEESGRPLDWFFEVYAHQAPLPRLREARSGDSLVLSWETGGGQPFPLPVEIAVGAETRRVDLPGGRAVVPAPAGAEIRVDPRGWLLRARAAEARPVR